MSQVKTVSAKKTTIFSAIASFAGMMAAVPVSLAIFSAAQPAHAMQMPTATDASYAQYAKAYTQGYLASTDGQTTGTCSEPQSTDTTEDTTSAEVTSATAKPQVMLAKANKTAAPMTKEEWTKNVTNSYNNYVTTNNTKTDVHTKNVNSNNTIGSNNTSTSSVSVKDSNGAVVSNNTSAAGSNFSNVDVHNWGSNNTSTNTAIINDSFNKDSHDKTVIVKDSGNTTNTTTTNNTAIVNDSFNKDDHSVDVNSGNTIDDSTHTKVDVKLENHHA